MARAGRAGNHEAKRLRAAVRALVRRFSVSERADVECCGLTVAQAATLVTECLKERPGDQEYLDFAVEVGAVLPPRAREIYAERAAAEALIAQAYRDGRVPSD